MAGLVLEIVEGASAGKQVPVGDRIEIGRDPGEGLALLDPQASRHHARIEPSGTGALVTDLDSTNGTYVNGQPVEEPRELTPGDRIRIGTTVLELRSAEQIGAQPSAVVAMPRILAAVEVLVPVPEDELSGVFEAPAIPAMRRAETPPGYVPRAIGGGGETPAGAPPSHQDPRLEGIVDARVKHQTSVAAFAFLAVAALVVLIYFGAT